MKKLLLLLAVISLVLTVGCGGCTSSNECGQRIDL